MKYLVAKYAKNDIAYNKYFELRFLDSLRFMSTSLDNLTRNLSSHPHLATAFRDKELLKRKGIFPYEHLKSFDVLKEPILPPMESFYSSFRLELVSEEEYAHANQVVDGYKCKTIKDYLLIYLKTDVLHLTDVFEQFRETFLDHYKLDLLWFYTAPSLAWNAMLKQTKVLLELISDNSVMNLLCS